MGLFDGLVDFGASRASDYAGSAAEWAQSAARAGKLPPLSGNQASLGAGVLNTVITHLQPQGCTNVGALRAGSDFLNFLGPTGQSVVSAAGYLADPLLGAGLSVGMTEYQQAFGQSCDATPYAPTARVAAGTAPTVPVSAGGTPGVVAQGGGGGGGAEWEDMVLAFLSRGQFMPMSANPIFFISWDWRSPVLTASQLEEDWVVLSEFLHAYNPGLRLAGEGTYDWLNRIASARDDHYIWSWFEGGNGEAMPGSGMWSTDVTEPVHWAYCITYPWDAWGSASGVGLVSGVPWMRDFAKWYKWQLSADGPEWSVLGFLRQFMASSGFRPDWEAPPPLAEV